MEGGKVRASVKLFLLVNTTLTTLRTLRKEKKALRQLLLLIDLLDIEKQYPDRETIASQVIISYQT